jgi:hypothetical protein
MEDKAPYTLLDILRWIENKPSKEWLPQPTWHREKVVNPKFDAPPLPGFSMPGITMGPPKLPLGWVYSPGMPNMVPKPYKGWM